MVTDGAVGEDPSPRVLADVPAETRVVESQTTAAADRVVHPAPAP